MKSGPILITGLFSLLCFSTASTHGQDKGKPAHAPQYRPGDLPNGRWQHAMMGVGYGGNLTTKGIQFMDIQAGRHYSMNGVTGTYQRNGDSLTFTGGSLDHATGNLQCRDGFLWMQVIFPDHKTQAWWGFSGGKVCP